VANHYDTIVVGVGGMGSATCWHLARRGQRVLGLERFDIPHNRGSSHGYTRIIRLAYYEHPSYVNLLRRAYALWSEIEAEAGEKLLHITGSIDAGAQDSWVFRGSHDSAKEHDLPHEVLSGKEINQRFPGYRLPHSHFGLFQPQGGFLLPERGTVAFANAAMKRGADIRAREIVLDFSPTSSGVQVRTNRATYSAGSLILTAGAWMSDLLPMLKGKAVPERQVLAWLQPRVPEWFAPSAFPVFNVEVEEGRYYGLPVYGVPGFKFGRYRHREQTGDPNTLLSEPDEQDEALLRAFSERYFPDGSGATMGLAACMFTNTADGHFILDRHPSYPQICLASPCSGHGYKFAPVIGEIMADLAARGETRHPVDLFRLSRSAA